MAGSPRSPRADATRNRERLLLSALAVFTGPEESATLEAVAREAGVGIGTLYRHFPTREALLEAVYSAELERLCDQAVPLLASAPPDVALRAWMNRYADFVATKRGLAQALSTVIASGAITSSATRERLSGAVVVFLDAGAAGGTLRGDVEPADVVASLAGVLIAAGGPDPRAQAGRMLDLLLDALRPRPGRT